MAIGLLGGTFDPVHNAHLAMARAALDTLGLEALVFLPTGSPKYRDPAKAPAKDRVAMLELALKGEPRFRIDERELRSGASGYTVDTLEALRAELGPQAEIYFLMGADQYALLHTWHRPEDLRRLAKLAVFARPGSQIADGSVRVVPLEPMDISASEIRARAARGEDLGDRVPPGVATYIQQHRLYS